MDREYKDAKGLTIRVGIALSAGMFSIIPVAYGAPSGGEVKAGQVTIVNAPKEVNITSTTKNNVISWQDFSIAKDEKVKFDGGNKTNNYLNIVRGANTSQIDGKIEGGNDVYIVNPNGVIFGKGASVNVGNLYVSTRYVSNDAAQNACNANNMAAVLASTDKSLASDVVNMGHISADKVIAEGKNIRFMNTTGNETQANSVELRTDGGYIHVGNATGDSEAKYSGKITGTAGSTVAIDWYKTVSADEVKNNKSIIGAGGSASGNYMLAEDVVLDGTENNITPVNKFTGKFDGMFNTVSKANINVASEAGIFGTTNGARIENFGVVNSTINSSGKNMGTGAIVGKAQKSILKNVYNENTSVYNSTTKTVAGGIIGEMEDTNIDSAYNTGNTNGGGILGKSTTDTNMIQNVYNLGTTGNTDQYGIFATTAHGNALLVKNAYTTSTKISSNKGTAVNDSFAVDTIAADKQQTTYTDAGWDITDTGGVKIDNAGNVTKSTWRIYGGKSNPLLTAFFKGTTAASYDYTMGGVSGNNDGKDFAHVYNASALNISNVTFGANADSSQINYQNSKDKNVTTGTYANFVSGQQGYDVAGSNITISKRQVNANVDTKFNPKKEYDGTADVTVAAVAGALTKTDTEDSGLVVGDTVTLAGNVTGKYYSDKDHTKEDKTVGKKKYGVINFNGLHLEGADSDNYELSINGQQNTDISFEAGEITPKALTLTTDASKRLTKVYDGTNAIKGTAADAIANLQVTGTIADDVVNVKGTNDATVAYDDVNAGTRNLIINGLTLDGDAAKNYYLKDSNGKVLYDPTGYFGEQITTANNVTANNAGLITPRMLDKNSFKVYNAVTGKWEAGSKTYDGTADFSYDTNTRLGQDTIADGFGTDSGILASDIDKIKFTLGGAKFTTADGTTAAPDATASGLTTAAKKLAYEVTITGTDNQVLSNYTFDTTSTENSTTLAQQPHNTVSGAGTINKRDIMLAGNNRTNLDKEYDSKDTVATNYNTWDSANGVITYADGSDQLVASDGTSVKLTGKYSDKNVAYDANGNIINKDITFAAELTGAKAANYNLVTQSIIQNKDNTAISGKITPKKLQVAFGDITKVYDGTTKVTAAMLTGKESLNGKISGDDLTIDLTNTAAQANYNSADVNTANKVYYAGITLGGADAKNYQLQNTDYTGNGTITKKTINSAADLEWRVNDKLTKIYDGNTNLPSNVTKDNLQLFVNGVSYDNSSTGLNYTLGTGSHYDSANSNNGQVQAVTYLIKLTDNSGNYDFGTGDFTNTVAGAGVITPRKVFVSVNNNKLTKEYDATTDVNNAKDYIAIKNSDSNTGFVNNDANDLNVSGKYADKNAGSNKNVDYILSLSGDSAGNYQLLQADNTAAGSLQGRGDITKHKLALTINDVRKTYDGDASVAADQVAGAITAQDNVTAIDADFANDFNTGNVTGTYGKQDSTGFVADANAGTDKTVEYKNLASLLTGTSAGNYEFTLNGSVVGNTAYGKGQIDKLTIDPASGWNFNFNFGGLHKVYDNTANALVNGISGKDNVSSLNFTNGTKTIDFLQNYDVNSVEYDSVNAGTRNVTYRIKLNGDLSNNYDLSSLDTLSGVSYDSATQTISKTIAGAGTIKQRKVYVGVQNNTPVSKIYDGTKELKPEAIANSSLIVQPKANDSGLLGTDNVTVSNTTAVKAHYADANAGENKEVRYETGLLNDANNNYLLVDMKGNALAKENGTSYVTGLGDITKRKLYVKANDVPPLSKIYDGTTAIENNSLANRIEIATKTNDSGLTGNDDVTINGSTSNLAKAMSGRYSDKNAGQAKDVYYEVALTGSDAGNYQLLNADGSELTKENGTSYVLGKGDIKKRSLNITFKNPNKDYDGSTYAKVNAVLEQATATTGLVAGDNFDSAAIKGRYGYIDTDGKFVASPDVISNKVKYTDLAAALGADADNYVLNAGDNTQILTPVTDDNFVGGGTINPLKITDSNLKVLLAKASKIYNGDSEVTHKTEDGSSLIAAKDNVKTLSVILKQADGSKDKEEKLDFSVKEANYADANAGKDKSVTYKLELKKLDNFTIDSNSVSGWDGTSLNLNGTGDIAKRQLKVNFSDVSKIYDGTNAVTDNIKATLNAGTKLGAEVINRDGLTLDNSKITGVYRDKNAGTAKDVSYTGISSALKAGDSSVLKNYELADIGNGKGNISKATLKVKQPSKLVEKVYDGTTKLVDNPYTTVDTLVDTKVIKRNGDKVNDILKFNPQDAVYSDKNAGKHDVDYKLNVDNTNYELVVEPIAGSNSQVELNSQADGSTSIKLKGMGVINKRQLTFKIADADKEYDGTTAVKDAINNIQADNVIGEDNINLIVNNAAYDNANAGISEDSDGLLQHEVNYNISINNSNYELTSGTLKGHGTIQRAKLTVTADQHKFRLGDKLPDNYSGQFIGAKTEADRAQLAKDFVFKLDETGKSTAEAGYDTYPVWGWYHNRKSGNYGQNYIFAQDSANKNAVKVTRALLPDANIVIDPDHNKTAGDITGDVTKDIAKDAKFTPDHTAYQQASGDEANNFKLNGSTAIEYRDVHGNLLADMTAENEDDKQASMQLKGSKTVVNLAGADVASKAAIALSSEGTGVNLTAEA